MRPRSQVIGARKKRRSSASFRNHEQAAPLSQHLPTRGGAYTDRGDASRPGARPRHSLGRERDVVLLVARPGEEAEVAVEEDLLPHGLARRLGAVEVVRPQPKASCKPHAAPWDLYRLGLCVAVTRGRQEGADQQQQREQEPAPEDAAVLSGSVVEHARVATRHGL